MKTKILYSITILLTLTFAFVVYSSTASSKSVVYASTDNCAMKDCCKDGKCSMSKEKDGKCACDMHKMEGTAAKHECNSDCCKDGKCTMSADGKCNCKDDSCPMMKKDGNKEMSAMNHGDACCKDGKCSMNSDCCKDGVCKMGCCKDGKCDMKAHKEGEATAMKGDCCKGDSCKMNHKKEGEAKNK